VKNSNVALASTGLLSETQEILLRLGKTVVLWELAFKTFGHHDRIGRLAEEGSCWYRYIRERGQASTHSYRSVHRSHWGATEKNLKQHIALLLRLSKEIRNTEVIALAVLMDSVDYAFVCGMMFYPSNVDHCWEYVQEKELPRVVNSLVRDFGGDPYQVEERLKLLYQQLDLGKHIPSCMYVAGE